MAKKRAAKEGSDDEEVETEQVKGSAVPKKVEKAGWNYTAIFLMMLFILPGFIAVVMQGYDIMYPEAKALRVTRERVTRCYESANPAKLNEVDKIVEKYRGREHVLFAQLRAKYPKHPEC